MTYVQFAQYVLHARQACALTDTGTALAFVMLHYIYTIVRIKLSSLIQTPAA